MDVNEEGSSVYESFSNAVSKLVNRLNFCLIAISDIVIRV